MTSALSSTTTTTGATANNTNGTGESAKAGSKALDREAFMKLLIAQISHQDPLQPMQGTEFVAQLSQFAIVEQAANQTKSLENLSAQINGIANNDATNLVGKRVTMRAKGMTFDGLTATTSTVTLARPATKLSAEILDDSGRVVRTITLGPKPAGALAVTWDGKLENGTTAARGNYSVRVNATDDTGAPVSVTQDITGTVTRVAFDKGYPELTLDNGAAGAVSDLVSVNAPPATPTTK